jgi:glycine betaine/proline transport system substrate-binding protein
MVTWFDKTRSIFNLTMAASMAVGVGLAPAAGAADMPGAGKTVTPCYDGTDESLFQTIVVAIGLEKLGYKVPPSIPLNVTSMYIAVAGGDATFTASAWDPLQNAFFEKAGGEAKLQHVGTLIAGATQGYFVDKKTTEQYHLTNIEQLKDPKIAAVFSDGTSGKAQLIGCPPGWGCERVIEHQLTAYGLRPTVNHVQGDMAVLASDVINRYKEGKPVLYYTYTPLWLSQVLVPGKDVEYLTVPFTSLPDKDDKSVTTLADGRNVGFSINAVRVTANADFLKANPAAKKWFELVAIPVADVNAENYQIYKGEKSLAQIRQHAENWVADHKAEVDGWRAVAAQAH